ncbi:MAG: hypothetical protein KJO38_11235 [Gammaproteobacteria bacterium]|nr:hypothetical protein [Gammaproteobacteria bacterium]
MLKSLMEPASSTINAIVLDQFQLQPPELPSKSSQTSSALTAAGYSEQQNMNAAQARASVFGYVLLSDKQFFDGYMAFNSPPLQQPGFFRQLRGIARVSRTQPL